jgi:hypothetical protein
MATLGAAAGACAVFGVLVLAGSWIEALSVMAGALTATVVAAAALRWRGRTVAVAVIVIVLGAGVLQMSSTVARDLWLGLVVGAGVAAAQHGLTTARGRGRWQAGLLAQTALIAVGVQLAYRQRVPVELLAWAGADKVLHAVFIGAVAFWANLALDGRAWRVGAFSVPIAIAAPLGLALIEEYAQGLASWRNQDGLDLLADAIGLGLFWAFSVIVRRLSPRTMTCGDNGG